MTARPSLALVLLLAACTPRVSPAELSTLRAELDSKNERSFDAALARAGLTRVPAPGPQKLFDGYGEGAGDGVYVVGTWSEAELEGPAGADFAKDAGGQIWHIQRRPKVSESDKVIVKGCLKGYDSGVAPAIYEVGYVLPDGVTIAGVKPIEYEAELLEAKYKDGPCYKGPPRP